jgi:hypothetical protein
MECHGVKASHWIHTGYYSNPSAKVDILDAAERGEKNAINWVKDEWGVNVRAGQRYINGKDPLTEWLDKQTDRLASNLTKASSKFVSSNQRLKTFVKSNFGSIDIKYGDRITWIVQRNVVNFLNGEAGRTTPDIFGARVEVAGILLLGNDFGEAYLATGHEIIHALHILNGQWDEWLANYGSPEAANAVSEFYAYTWQITTARDLGIDDMGAMKILMDVYMPLVPFDAIIKFSQKK